MWLESGLVVVGRNGGREGGDVLVVEEGVRAVDDILEVGGWRWG